MNKFDDVVNYFGSQSEMSRQLGITRQAVTLWKTAGFIPAKNAIEIEKITFGKFKAVDLASEDK